MNKPKVYAYYFPNWHVDSKNEKWHGKGWTEWEVVKCARPKFEGHIQPKVPLWGYEDESDPKVMEKKIQAASDYGLDGFIFDWYWHTDGPYRKRCLEEGFLGAENNQKLEFGVMWCNHDAGTAQPSLRVPLMHKVVGSDATKELFYEITQYCIDNYFAKPNYIKIDGKPYFSIHRPMHFVREMGIENAIEALNDFRERAKKAGYPGIHFSVHNTFWCNDHLNVWKPMSNDQINDVIDLLGINSIANYGWGRPLDTFPVYDHSKVVETEIKNYLDRCQVKVPVVPSVLSGWDSSPRTVQSDIYENVGYPFTPIGINNSPELFESNLTKMYRLAEEHHAPFLAITAWNEWTEGNYLEPCEEYGYGMLEALKRFKDKVK